MELAFLKAELTINACLNFYPMKSAKVSFNISTYSRQD
jgi:hypothetical protein